MQSTNIIKTFLVWCFIFILEFTKKKKKRRWKAKWKRKGYDAKFEIRSLGMDFFSIKSTEVAITISL